MKLLRTVISIINPFLLFAAISSIYHGVGKWYDYLIIIEVVIDFIERLISYKPRK